MARAGVVLERGRVGEEDAPRASVRYLRAVDKPHRTDVAVIGAGAAGLYAALVAAGERAQVALVSRSPLAQTASYWAQGGIAAAIDPEDSPEEHTADTLRAGRDAARESAVRALCEESPARVRDLQELGVQFDADRSGKLALGLEGGHSKRRIVHAGGSATGRRITRDLSAIVATHERIRVLEPLAATSLATHDGRCVGLTARARDGVPVPIRAGAVVLATGGMAALWQRTTNPRGAVGAGLTLASAAGAALADLEFMQFHPTALRLDGPRDGFLVTEAVRGEGATLLNVEGERFVDELAPRDQVALAIQAELEQSGEPAVSLDMRAVDVGRFPNIAAALAEVGLDPTRDLPAGGARCALHDGRGGGRPRRALVAARPLRRGRERVHGAPRRQPARLQLARGVLRVRPARCAGGERGAPAARRVPDRRPAGDHAPRGADPGSALAGERAWSAIPRACANSRATRSRSRAEIGASCPRARGEPRGAPADRPPERRTRSSTTCTTWSLATEPSPSFELWR